MMVTIHVWQLMDYYFDSVLYIMQQIILFDCPEGKSKLLRTEY